MPHFLNTGHFNVNCLSDFIPDTDICIWEITKSNDNISVDRHFFNHRKYQVDQHIYKAGLFTV